MEQLVSREITYAPKAFQMLRGAFCLYKPPNKGFRKTQLGLRQKIVHELNSMECRPPRERIVISGDLVVPEATSEITSTSNSKLKTQSSLTVSSVPNLADHPLVCGPRYAEEHISIRLLNNPGWFASGLVLGLIGPTTGRGHRFNRNRFPAIYELKGELGFATENNRSDGKVIAKTTWRHLKRDYYDRVLAKIESAQRGQMFKHAGVDLRSEAAYQMAIDGFAFPPNTQTAPLLTALRSLSFTPPNFSIQVETFNEQEDFLAGLICEIGLALKTTAHCTGIRLTKLGPFNVEEHALLQKHWDLENLLENIFYCNKLMREYAVLDPPERKRMVENPKTGAFEEADDGPFGDGVRL